MAKTLTNKEVTKNELNFMLSRLRSAIAYEGKTSCSIYLAGVHKETYDALTAMGIAWSVKGWCTKLNAPKNGTKVYKALFNGSNVLAEAKAEKEAKAAAEKKAKAEKAAPKAEKPKKDATVKKAAAKAEKPKTEKKAEKKVAAPKAEKKAKKVAPKVETPAEAPAETKAE